MSWFDTALAMVTRTTLEVTVKNTIAQITKEFYGYGPRSAVRCTIQGPLILHVTLAAGSAILDELGARPAGQVVLQYNNELLVERYRERLAALARLALRTEMLALFSDFDAPSRQIIGGALLGRPLNHGHRPADPRLARALRTAVTAAGGPAAVEVLSGPGCFWSRVPAAGWVPAPAGEEDRLAALTRWRAWRDRLTGGLRAACEREGVQPEATFAGLDQGLLVLGGVMPGTAL